MCSRGSRIKKDEEADLQELREEFSHLIVTSPEELSLNEVLYLWDRGYASYAYRDDIDFESAYAWLVLLLEISAHLMDAARHISFEISAMNLRLNFIMRFGSELHPELKQEIIEWADEYLSHFDLEEMKAENENWRSLPPNRIRQLGELRNVLAFIRRNKLINDELTTSNCEEWLEFSTHFLR